MRFTDVLDEAAAVAADARWLQAELAPATAPGRRAAAAVRPFRPGEEPAARSRAAGIAAMAEGTAPDRMIVMRTVLRGVPDALPALEAAAAGTVLDDAGLLEVLRFLDGAVQIETALPSPGVQGLAVGRLLRELRGRLESGRAGNMGFYLADTFSDELTQARGDARRAQAAYDSARGRLCESVASALGREDVSDDEFIVMRAAVAALPAGVRVIREAPTYYLCKVQLDAAALESLQRRDAADEAVARAETAVRADLSEAVARAADALENLCAALGEFDVLLASAAFAQRYACSAPVIVDEPRLAFRSARLLPLAAELEQSGGRYEPISLDISDVAVLTGPNMGGKSATLRTCAFVAALSAFGLPVPAEAVSISLFDRVAWVGGAGEEPGGLLSSFAHEIVRLNDVLCAATPAGRLVRYRPLLLADEFARTTTPREGTALTLALVEWLRATGWIGLLATHLSGVANRAGIRHFVVRGLRSTPVVPAGAGLEQALRALANSMDYGLEEVHGTSEPSGDAIALARLLGLNGDLLAHAAAVLSDNVEGEPPWIR